MTERWKSYIDKSIEASRGVVPFALNQWAFLFPVFLAIRRALPSGGRILDVGCGAGAFTALLAHHGYSVTGIDQDPEIVARARQMVEYFRSTARIEQGDAFDLATHHGRFDLVYSLGVLEHFEPRVTIQLIEEQARCGRFVLVAVPTRYTCYAAPVTDERLYNRRELCQLVRQAGLKVTRSFVYGDIPTRTAINLERCLPKALHRLFKHLFSYGMGVFCVGERP